MRNRSKQQKRRTIREANDDAVYISVSQICARYGGRTRMWFERLYRDDSDFPRAFVLRKIRYFRLADVIAWERRRAADRAA